MFHMNQITPRGWIGGALFITLTIILAIGDLTSARSGTARLATESHAPITVADSSADLDEYISLQPAAVFRVKQGTRVRVLSRGPVRSQVKITSGEHAGRIGWVPSEWVK